MFIENKYTYFIEFSKNTENKEHKQEPVTLSSRKVARRGLPTMLRGPQHDSAFYHLIGNLL
jgi:hypothetical protein